MAQRKTSYTNADLKTGGPATEYGPWTNKQGGDPYEDMLAEPMSVEDILAGAKQNIVKPNVAGDARRAQYDQEAAGAQQYAEEGSTLMGQMRQNPMDTAKRGMMGAALPLSFAGGPIGAAASVPLAIEALTGFAEDPSVMGGVGATASMIPAARLFKGAKAGANTLNTGGATAKQATQWNAGRAARAEPAYRPLTRAQMPAGASPRPSSIEVGPLPPAPRSASTGTAWGPPPKPWGSFSGKPGSPSTSVSRSPQEDYLSTLNEKWNPSPFRGDGITRSEGLPRESMAGLVDDVPFEQLDTPPMGGYDTYQGVPRGGSGASEIDELIGGMGGPVSKTRQAAQGPPVQRVPRGAQGDEYASVREPGGAFDPRNTRLAPEEASVEDEFWEQFMSRSFGR